MKTLHGEFEFELQKYLRDGKSVSYFDLTEQMSNGYMSVRLQELSSYYSNRMSYEEVAKLVERVTGSALLSDQTIWQIVNTKAIEVSERLRAEVETTLSSPVPIPKVNATVDIYDQSLNEILIFEDGIQVKQQKEKRVRRSQQETGLEVEPIAASKRPRVNTDIILLQQTSGAFAYLSAPIDEAGQDCVSLAKVVQAGLIEAYGQTKEPLNLVMISDGAKTIRLRVVEIFGRAITLILDWYHLSKKVRELMSMIACNKVEKSQHVRELFRVLWRGQVQTAVAYLKNQVPSKNAEKLAELVGYLQKHEHEIIDYERRQHVGKTIGSGRVEKAVDQVIGHRQKQKGSSWRTKGSKALAILRMLELNGQWKQAWFPVQAT